MTEQAPGAPTELHLPTDTTVVAPCPPSECHDRSQEVSKTPAVDTTIVEKVSKTNASKMVFMDLPEDLQIMVLERVIRPSDAKNACLVSKRMHKLAVRSLYRHVNLDLGSPTDARLSSFLNPRNIGLPWVRQLRLYLFTNPQDRCLNQEQQAHFATRMILEFLPEDILEEFSWCPWRPFDSENLLLLYKKQRKMKWLEVMDLDKPVLPEIQKSPRLQQSMFANAKKLALYPENQETLDMGGYFVENVAAHLEELIVHCNFHNDDSRESSAIDARELLDSATGPGILTRSIFRSRLPFDSVGPFQNLRSLRLHRVSLRYCADTWCKLINLHELQCLRLYHCTGADTMLGQMCKASNLPKNLKVLEIQHRDNPENELLMALDGFLCLVSGIRDLVIDIERVKSMPAAAGIVRHAKTLETLNVHCAPNPQSGPIQTPDCDTDESFWSIEDFEKICRACTRIEQLSCAWPPTSLIRSPSDEWRAYENACRSLRNLVTLQITSWPSNKPSTQLLPRSVYETLLQALAQRTFELAVASAAPIDHVLVPDSTALTSNAVAASPKTRVPSSSRLRLVAFGISDKIYERENSLNQLIYLRSTCRDAEGRLRVYATPVTWCHRQYIEARSEILDFVLHRSDPDNRPPCRDDPMMTGSHGDAATGVGAIMPVWADEDD